MIDLNASGQAEAERVARRSNRRRLIVFAVVFLAIALPGETWNFLRPAEYRATARIQVTPGSASSPRVTTPAPLGGTAFPASTQPADFLTQVQILTSRPLLQQVADAFAKAGRQIGTPAVDAVQTLQNMIQVTAAPGTEVLELQAIGAPPEIPAAALNSLIEIYRVQLEKAHGSNANDRLAEARDEAERMEKAVAAKRAAVSAFRVQSGVVSSERDENAALSRIKGLSASLNTAIEKAAIADSRVKSLREAAASGSKGGTQAKDDPTLASMEMRASQAREELRDMERTYTPAFMSMDPRARALRARLAELEKQVATQRSASQQNALANAQEEAAAARATVERLQGQISTEKQGAQAFSSRFAQAKALEEDLAQIERANREAQDRVAKLQATERGRRPVFRLLEAASVPQTAYRPDYLRDGLYIIVAAFGLGLLAMWFVDLFNRAPAPAPAPSMVVVPQPWPAPGHPPGLEMNPLGPALAGPGAGSAAPVALPPVAAMLRELEQGELRKLIDGADPMARRACVCLLAGLSEEETLDLRRTDVNPARATLAIGGGNARNLSLPPWATALLAASTEVQTAPLLCDAAGAQLDREKLHSLVLCAALDAGLDGAEEVTPEVLRHTCIAWLVRQGIRFSDLAARVGSLGSGSLARYAALAPEGPKVDAAEIPAVMPALRDPPSR